MARLSTHMNDGTTPRCQKRVFRNDGILGTHGQCRRAVKKGDSVWCGQHAPEAEAVRKTKRLKKFGEDSREYRLRRAAPGFLEALTQIADGCEDPRKVARDAVDAFDKRSLP